MSDDYKQEYHEKYAREKEHGVKFFPDIIFKDMVFSFGVFVLLVGLAIFVGVKNEPPADPSDSAYIPRPEWYFLFLFEMLKYFPGQIEWIGTTLIPAVAVIALLLLPFFDKNRARHWSKRKLGISIMSGVVLAMVVLSILAVITTPPQEEVALASTLGEQVTIGQDVYSVQCVECHGAEGEGGEIIGVEGLEEVVLDPINSTDVMYTFTDDTLFNIVDYGQPSLGMPPFGLAYGGELSRGDITALVNFMRYTWDDRAELPAEAAAASAIPELKPGEVPSYEVHISVLSKRYCVSCHRPNKENNEYLMQSYEEILTSGDNAPNLIAGDLGSNLIRMLHREEIEAGGPMPPTKALKAEYIDIWERWVMGGMPNTAADAAALSTTATEAVPEAPAPSPTP
ncbi:MAG TPA: c-type cytochrome [Anaerolineales bacterium]|nr:c-type cytochrome [Anaerolineales bacterium]